MPRDRVITMGKVTPQEAHEAALQKAIKLHSPYVTVEGELVGSGYKYAVVYTAPLGGERRTAAERNKMANANSVRDMLNHAWAEGYWASSSKRKNV